jgi:hypothetical protein
MVRVRMQRPLCQQQAYSLVLSVFDRLSGLRARRILSAAIYATFNRIGNPTPVEWLFYVDPCKIKKKEGENSEREENRSRR